LIPTPKHILIDKDEEGNIKTSVFAEQQTAGEFLSILGYGSKKPVEVPVEANELPVPSNN